MWWLRSTTILRERAASASRCDPSKRYKHAVACQLDYYMSHQFAGVACALVDGAYAAKGLDLAFLPTCPVGLEQSNVRKHQDENPSSATIGSVEQNIFIPTLLADSSLKTTAVAAMFGKSPLCIASLKKLENDSVIGAHEDTVWLLQRMFPNNTVIASPRATKNSDLLSGKIGGIQAYTTTEVPTLKHLIGEEPVVTPLEGLNGTTLGYSQVLFAADECLEGDRRDVVSAFLEATFEGWAKSINDPKEAVESVKEAKKMLKLDDENNDHWHASPEYDDEMLDLCNNHVKETLDGNRYGVIDPDRWDEASRWLTGGKVAPGTGLDSSLW